MAQQLPVDGWSRSPLRLSTNVVFIIGATTLAALTGWLVKTGSLTVVSPGTVPLQTTFPDWGIVIFGIWMLLAVLTSVVFPLLALIRWRRYQNVRAVLLPYLGLLLVQIPTEILFTQLFFPNMVALIGMVYTSYRVYQLSYFRRMLVHHGLSHTHQRAVHMLLLAGLCFWSANFVFLLFMLATRVFHI